MIGPGAGEEALRDRFITAGAEITPFEIAAAHVTLIAVTPEFVAAWTAV